MTEMKNYVLCSKFQLSTEQAEIITKCNAEKIDNAI